MPEQTDAEKLEKWKQLTEAALAVSRDIMKVQGERIDLLEARVKALESGNV